MNLQLHKSGVAGSRLRRITVGSPKEVVFQVDTSQSIHMCRCSDPFSATAAAIILGTATWSLPTPMHAANAAEIAISLPTQAERSKYVLIERQRIEDLVIQEFTEGLANLSDEDLTSLLEEVIRSRQGVGAGELWTWTRRQQPDLPSDVSRLEFVQPRPSLSGRLEPSGAPEAPAPDSHKHDQIPESMTAPSSSPGPSSGAPRSEQPYTTKGLSKLPVPAAAAANTDDPGSNLFELEPKANSPAIPFRLGRPEQQGPPAALPRVAPAETSAAPARPPAASIAPDLPANSGTEEPDYTRQLLQFAFPSFDPDAEPLEVGQRPALQDADRTGPSRVAGQEAAGTSWGPAPLQEALARLAELLAARLEELPSATTDPLRAIGSWVQLTVEQAPFAPSLPQLDLRVLPSAVAGVSGAVAEQVRGLAGSGGSLLQGGPLMPVGVGLFVASTAALALATARRAPVVPSDEAATRTRPSMSRSTPPLRQQPDMADTIPLASSKEQAAGGGEAAAPAADTSGNVRDTGARASPGWTAVGRFLALLPFLSRLFPGRAPVRRASDSQGQQPGSAAASQASIAVALSNPNTSARVQAMGGSAYVSAAAATVGLDAATTAAGSSGLGTGSKSGDPRWRRLMDNGPVLEVAIEATPGASPEPGLRGNAATARRVLEATGEPGPVLWKRLEPEDAPPSALTSGQPLWRRSEDADTQAPARGSSARERPATGRAAESGGAAGRHEAPLGDGSLSARMGQQETATSPADPWRTPRDAARTEWLQPADQDGSTITAPARSGLAAQALPSQELTGVSPWDRPPVAESGADS